VREKRLELRYDTQTTGIAKESHAWSETKESDSGSKDSVYDPEVRK
jgi:hypothetical protein